MIPSWTSRDPEKKKRDLELAPSSPIRRLDEHFFDAYCLEGHGQGSSEAVYEALFRMLPLRERIRWWLRYQWLKIIVRLKFWTAKLILYGMSKLWPRS